MDQFVKRLTNDLRKSPAKTGFLAVMTCVAIYFWAPLVGKAFRSEAEADQAVAQSSSANEEATTSSAQSSDSVPATTGAAQNDASSLKWDQLVATQNLDQSLRPRSLPVGRNPFAWSTTIKTKLEASRLAVQEKTEEPITTAEIIATPAELGMQFRGSMIGGRRRIASINGQSYAQGESVEVESPAHGPTSFVLRHVSADRIILERNGRQFELPLRKKSGTNWRISTARPR